MPRRGVSRALSTGDSPVKLAPTRSFARNGHLLSPKSLFAAKNRRQARTRRAARETLSQRSRPDASPPRKKSRRSTKGSNSWKLNPTELISEPCTRVASCTRPSGHSGICTGKVDASSPRRSTRATTAAQTPPKRKRKRSRTVARKPWAKGRRGSVPEGWAKFGSDYQQVTAIGGRLEALLRKSRKGSRDALRELSVGRDAQPGDKFFSHVYGNGVDIRRTTLPNTSHRNRGLFASVDIEKNALITEYDGIRISREDAMAMRRAGKATHVKGLNYDVFLDGNRWPLPGQGAAQLANDGRGVFKNNAKFVILYDSKIGRDRCFLKALTRLSAGDEVFVSYGRGYWDAHSAMSR